MDSGSFFLGVMSTGNKGVGESFTCSLLIPELMLSSVGIGFFFSSWPILFGCLFATVVISFVPFLRFILALILTLFFSTAGFMAGHEHSLLVGIISFVVAFLVVGSLHFDIPENDINEK